MRGDAGVQLEGMAYAYARDAKIDLDYKAAMAQVETVKSQLAALEAASKVPAGATDMVATVLIGMDGDLDALELSIGEQKAFLAQAMGMVNPKAVRDLVVPDAAIPVEAATVFADEPIISELRGRSFETRQLDYLIHAASLARTAAFFSWMDPACDPTAVLGLGTPDLIAVRTSQVEALKIQRRQTEGIVLQKAEDAILEFNDSLDDHERAQKNFEIQERRMQRNLSAVQAGQDVNLFDLVTGLQQHLDALIDLRTTEAVYRMTRAKLDRLRLQGNYAHISLSP
jgi:hypothetical protein